MSSQKPSIPKGTRDFTPVEVNKRNFIIEKIRHQFNLFGFSPIETPSFENLSTLTGKYGEEGDRLIFKILNSGDFLSKADAQVLSEKNSQRLTPQISEKALRYDLTVPFARYVVQHQNEITFPFKRYQIQPVWRADRPQKGRFREFFQCDADAVGSDSLWQEVELISMYDSVFDSLYLKTEIHINNRKILSGLAEIANISHQLIDFTVALDKLDKIGDEKVKEEMLAKGITSEAIEILSPLFSLEGQFENQIRELNELLENSEVGKIGISEMEFIYKKAQSLPLKSSDLVLNLTLARGLDYYTGTILEVKAKEVELGSIGGGGRYDDLTGIFGMKDLSGVGISFGLDRIYLVMDELHLFSNLAENQLDILFLNFGEAEMEKSFQLAQELRTIGISCEIYPDPSKLKKQMNYADKRNVKYVAMIGKDEFVQEKISLKKMSNGEQITLNNAELSQFMSESH